MLELLKPCSGSGSAVAEAKKIERISEKDQALMFGSHNGALEVLYTHGHMVHKFTCHHTRKTHTDRHMDGAQGNQSGYFPVQFFQGMLSPDSRQLFNDSSCFSKRLRVRTRALEPSLSRRIYRCRDYFIYMVKGISR
jgi:hypothetical protein